MVRVELGVGWGDGRGRIDLHAEQLVLQHRELALAALDLAVFKAASTAENMNVYST